MFGPGGVRAQPSANSPVPHNLPTDTLRLTLEQSVALALKQNPTQQIAVIDAAESVQDKNITRADLLPQANFQASESVNRVNVKAQFGGLPLFPGIPGHIGPYELFSAGPSFGGSVFDFSLFKPDTPSAINLHHPTPPNPLPLLSLI